MFKDLFKHLSIVIISLLLLPLQTSAQQVSGQVLEEILVTAEKRSQDLQEAALVGTVFNEDLMRQNSIDEIDDLEFVTPSLTIATAGQSNQMNLRGIGKFDSGGTSTSAVATYRDGVGTVSGFFNQEPYYDIASIEVLRGPQGTFVGENAAAGAIFVNTRNPDLEGGYDGFVELGAANYDGLDLTAAVNLPIHERFAVRVATKQSRRDSFFDVYLDQAATVKHPRDPGEIDYSSFRISALYRPIDALEILLKLDHNRLDHGGHVYGNVPGFPSPIGSLTGQPYGNISSDLYTVGNNYVDVYAKDEMARAILDVNYDFSNGSSLRWVSGIQYIHTHVRNDDDGSVDEDIRQFILPVFRVRTTELTYLSPEDQSIRWLVGAFYRREELEFPFDEGFQIYQGPDPATLGLSILWDTPRQTEAAYAQVAFDLTDDLELEAGIRLQHYKSEQDADLRIGNVSILRRIDDYSESTFNYKVALNWSPSEEHYFYAFIATGNTTGGSSVVLGVPNFDNQRSTDYELGWKGTLLDGQVRTQFGGFYTVIKDYQASFAAVIDATQTPPLLSNTFQNLDGKTKTWGIELQLQSQFDNLGIDFNAAYINSELGDDLIFDTTLNRFLSTGGERIPWTPEYTFNIGVHYDFYLGNGATLTPRVTYSWIDEQTVTTTDRVIGGVPVDRIFDHEMVNLQLNFEYKNWRVQAFMTNANEEEYIQAHSGAPAHPDAYANEPRRYGIRFTYDFGAE